MVTPAVEAGESGLATGYGIHGRSDAAFIGARAGRAHRALRSWPGEHPWARSSEGRPARQQGASWTARVLASALAVLDGSEVVLGEVLEGEPTRHW